MGGNYGVPLESRPQQRYVGEVIIDKDLRVYAFDPENGRLTVNEHIFGDLEAQLGSKHVTLEWREHPVPDSALITKTIEGVKEIKYFPDEDIIVR